jgi:UDP-glucose 4-epimerase
MRALVTGGAGFLGSHLVDRLLAEGHAVDAVDDLSSGSLANLGDARAVQGELRFHTLDVRAPELLELVRRRPPDVVFHLAARSFATGAREATEVAVMGTLNVLEVARQVGVAKIVAPLDAAELYGEVPAKDLPVRDGTPWVARSLAGVAARTIADLLAVYRQNHAIEFTALALASVFGPRQPATAGVVAAFVAADVLGLPCHVHGDGRQTRDLLYVDDAVDAFVRAATRGSGLVVNVGTGVQTSVRDLHRMVAGPNGVVTKGPARPGEIGRFAVSPVRARIHLAWAPWTELADGIARVRDAAHPSHT